MQQAFKRCRASTLGFNTQHTVTALSCVCQQARPFSTDLGCPDGWQTCDCD